MVDVESGDSFAVWPPASALEWGLLLPPRWAPDGVAFTFVSWVDGRPEVFLVELR